MVSHNSSRDESVTAKQRMRRYGNIIKCYGENMSFGFSTPVETMIQLLVDDGNTNRGHRKNIFSPDFNYIGCYTGKHNGLDSICVIDYAGGFVTSGEDDIIEKQMSDFMKEEVTFRDMPASYASWRQKSKISVDGTLATKTTTRSLKLKDGSEKKLTVTLERQLALV